jgi:hypothetical protein
MRALRRACRQKWRRNPRKHDESRWHRAC